MPVTNGNQTIEVIRCNVSIVSIFVIPDLLLMATYFYGIYLFWSGQEYLQNLAGQVGVATLGCIDWLDHYRYLCNATSSPAGQSQPLVTLSTPLCKYSWGKCWYGAFKDSCVH